MQSDLWTHYSYKCVCVCVWSDHELLAPFVNMIKEGSEN